MMGLFIQLTCFSIVFLVMAQTTLTIFPGFEGVNFSDNSNIKVQGSNNNGTVLSNENLNLHVSNCILNICKNTNSKISMDETNISCTDSTNVNLSGSKSKVIIQGNENLKFVGTHANLETFQSSNLRVEAHVSSVTLKNIQNGNFCVKNCTISGQDNKNIKVEGDGGQVKIKDTTNHEIRRTPSLEASNLMEVTVESSQINEPNRFFCVPPRSWLLSNSQQAAISANTKAKLLYRDTVEIDKNNYKLDSFEFNLCPKSEVQFDVEFSGDLDRKSLETKRVSETEMHISKNVNGKVHILKFIAPKILPISNGNPASFTVLLKQGCNI